MISRGKSHKCTTAKRVTNLTEIVQRSISKRTGEQVISSLLKNKVQEMTKSQKYFEMALTTSSGKPLRVILARKERLSVEVTFSASDMQKVQRNLNLSQRKTVKLASMMRVMSKKRKIIVPNLKKKLSANLHSLDTFFEAKSFNFSVVKAQKVSVVERCVVLCKNLKGLIEYVKEKRATPQVHLKFGIDGGGGFLKICLSMQSLEDTSYKEITRQKYGDGAASRY